MSRGAPELWWRIRGWLAWFVVLNVLWLVLISAWVPAEEILGLFAAAIGGDGRGGGARAGAGRASGCVRGGCCGARAAVAGRA